LVPSIVITDRA